MIKSVTFISIATTTFVLVLLGGVVYAYQGFISPTLAVQQPSSPQTINLPLIAPTSTNIPDISPQDAASIAVKFSSRTDLYSVELAAFNGAQTYKVTFSSGDTVFVALNGQVVGSTPPSQSAITSPTSQPKPSIIYSGPIKKAATAGHGGSSGSTGGGGGDGHEGGGD